MRQQLNKPRGTSGDGGSVTNNHGRAFDHDDFYNYKHYDNHNPQAHRVPR